MSTEEVIFPIHDKVSANVGFAGKFINNELISLHGFIPVFSSTKDQPTKHAKSQINVFHVSPNFILDDEIVRSLVGESSNIFHNLQVVKEKTNDLYLQTSRIYRSAIRSTLNRLQEAASEDEDPDNVKKYENYVTIFYSIECLWHLCEFLLIDRSTVSVVPNLLEWTKFHFPTPSQAAAEMLINKDRDSEFRGSYWDTIKSLVLQGQADIARALLKLNSASETMTFQLAEKELHSMPVFNVHGGLSLQKFRSQWSFWSTSLQSKIDSGLFSSEPELETVMKLITGDKEAWKSICKISNCWYEYFAGYLFYTQPAVRYFELGAFADNWLSQWAANHGNTGYTSLKSLDRMVLAVLKNDMTELIHSVQEVGDNKWFVVHLVDLLVHSDQLKISNDSNNLSEIALRENLIFDYGTMLMSKGSLWEIGMEYLEFSSPEGIGAREMLLERVPLRNDFQATKVIEVARRYNMTAVEQKICRIMVKRSLSHENYGNALEWAIRSRDNIYVTKVANIFLHNYCNTGKMIHKDVLANVGAKMFIAPRLLFLIKYFEFYQFYVDHAYSQAAELLVNLLDSKIIPEFFWPSLMTDTIPLLEHNEPIIPSKETYTILHHLESDLIPYIEKMKLERKTEDEAELNLINACPDNLVEALRLACARNLQRAMIIENTLVR